MPHGDGGSSNRGGAQERDREDQKRQRSPEFVVLREGSGVNPLNSSDILIPVLSSRMFTTPQLCQVQRVCRSWRETLQDGDLTVELWRDVTFSPFQDTIDRATLVQVVSPRRAPVVRTLSLQGCVRLSEEDVFTVLEMLTSSGESPLESLELSRCGGVTDVILRRIAHSCPNLKFLALNGVANVTDRGLQVVVQRIPGLKMVEAAGSGVSTRLQAHIEQGNFKILVLPNYTTLPWM